MFKYYNCNYRMTQPQLDNVLLSNFALKSSYIFYKYIFKIMFL